MFGGMQLSTTTLPRGTDSKVSGTRMGSKSSDGEEFDSDDDQNPSDSEDLERSAASESCRVKEHSADVQVQEHIHPGTLLSPQ